MRSLALALSVLALLLAGCGSERQQAGSTTPTDPVESQTTPTETGATVPNEAPMVVALYFLRGDWVGRTQRSIVSGPQVGTAALKALLEGPSSEDRAAGLRSAIPKGTRLERLSISGGTATATATFSEELGDEGLGQVVFTLTQFSTVKRVVVGDRAPLSRAQLEELTPPILVESPAPGEDGSSPLRITGTANTFEATFNVEVLDADGRTLGKRFVTATSGSGTRGTFDTEVRFRVERAGPGKLVVFESSAEDGSRLHEVEIPLKLVP